MLHPLGLIVLATPVFVVALIALAGWLLHRHGPRWSFLLAPVLVLGTAVADHAYSTGEFHKACQAASRSVVLERVQANGFLLESASAGDFGTSFLLNGFRWIERRSGSGAWERVSANADGSIRVQAIEQASARYLLVEKVDQSRSWKFFSRAIFDRKDNAMLATTGYVLYSGGTLSWMLWPFNHADCPRVPGGDRFNDYFRLPRLVLQPHAPGPQPKP